MRKCGTFRPSPLRSPFIELKSVEQISKAHRKQLQTYLRLAELKLGYLFNFGSALMKEGIVRAVNGLDESFDSREAFGNDDPRL